MVEGDGAQWEPESGQQRFLFDGRKAGAEVKPLLTKPPALTRDDLSIAEWFSLGCELESRSPYEARDAYRRVLEKDPRHADAHINLGRLLHESGDLGAARSHYMQALGSCPQSAIAAFNLGVVLEDTQDLEGAVGAYQAAIAQDSRFEDAYYNLAGVLERLERDEEALRALRIYRTLSRER